MIAALCSRLDGVSDHDLAGAADLIARYRSLLGQGPSELDQLPADIAKRLEIGIALSNERYRDRDCGSRFRDTFADFIEGIGSADSRGADEDVHRFRYASMNYLERLLNEAPFMMENYLLNYVYQHLFPFGRAGSVRFLAHTMSEEAVLLITQYSWMMTLLTGVAAKHGPAFGKEHLITTVQSFTRAVEHAPQIFEDALDLIRSHELDNLSGLAKLLRT